MGRTTTTSLLARARTRVIRTAVVFGVVTIAIGAAVAPAAAADSRPNLHSPFACGQVWFARTYAGHPQYAVDWNLPGSGEADFGQPVFAGGAGVATVGQNAGYGNMVTIDNGAGWTTLYAHLSSVDVATGEQVSALTLVGHVGRSGNADGSHLHQEQSFNGVRQPIQLAGVAVVASMSSRQASYQSANCSPVAAVRSPWSTWGAVRRLPSGATSTAAG